MIRTLLTIATLAATAATVHAQDLALTEVEADDTMVEPLGMNVGELDDMTVYDGAGEAIGEIGDVLQRPDGEITAVSVEVGGFLGMGEKDVVMSLNDLQTGDDGLTTGLSAEEIGVLPEYDD